MGVPVEDGKDSPALNYDWQYADGLGFNTPDTPLGLGTRTLEQ